MESEFFKKLYAVSANDFFAIEDYKKSFVFQGSKNWDCYLDSKPLNTDFSIFENVEILGFKKKNDFLEYMDKSDLIDYSLEHFYEENRYFILIESK